MRRRRPCNWEFTVRTRGEWCGTVKNCRSKAEAIRKLKAGDPDVYGDSHWANPTTVISCVPDTEEDDGEAEPG